MNHDKTLLVATVGQAVMRSHDDGASWHRLKIDQDLEFDDSVRCLLPDPRNPRAVFAGAETGLFRSEDCGVNWRRVDCVLNSYAVWKLVGDTRSPDIMYAGTGSPSRATLFRSHDGGRHWEETSLRMPPKCAGVSRPRMLAIAIDPDDARDVWVGVEEGGLHRTRDGGDTWQRIDRISPNCVRNPDLHAIVILSGQPKTHLALAVNALYTSIDGGETWSEIIIREHWDMYYSRVLTCKPGGSSELLMAISDGTPGTTSILLRSRDRGATWVNAPLPVQPNSCIWAIGANDSDPNYVLAGTKYGNLFRSVNGGAGWRKEWREFSEIADVTWLPAVPEGRQETSHGHP